MATSSAVGGALTAHDRRVLTAVNAGASSLSLAGSSFIVLCYLLFKELRKFSFKLVFYLALSFLQHNRVYMLDEAESSSNGYSTHFFCVASFLWTTTIAFTLHRTVVKHKTDVEDLEAMFHLYVWEENANEMASDLGYIPRESDFLLWSKVNYFISNLPCRELIRYIFLLLIGTSLVMTVMRSFGNDHIHFGAWCWTQTGRAGKAVHFVTFYMPLWGAILYNGFTYFQVIRMLNNATRMAVGMSCQALASDTRDNMRALNRWGYYPLILIGSWAFGTINRIHDFFEPNHKIFWLTFLDVGTAALMGLFNSIAYGLNSSVRRAICERLDKFWPERLYRWLPNSLKYKNLQQESELVLFKTEDQ